MLTRLLPLAFVFVALVAAGCQNKYPPGAIVGESGEYLRPKFDDREWKTVNQREAKNVSVSESVPKGQSRNKWTESLGGGFRSYATRADVGLEAQRLREGISDRCPAHQWFVHRNTPADTVVEWRIENCEGHPDQTEIRRYVAGRTGVYSIAYVKKGPPLTWDERHRWIGLLSQATLEDLPDER
jgi:hypothetical protein